MRGSFETPRIVQPGGRRTGLLWLLALVVAAALSWKIFEFGRERGGFDAGARDTEVALLEKRIETLQKERDELRALVARHQRSSQIDRAAVKVAQADLTALQEERSELRQQLEFYKSLVSGSVALLQITDLSLNKQESGNTYSYVFTVSKRAKDKERVTGSVVLSVAGQLKGEASEIGASKLGLENDSFRMGFRHFQTFEGELTLPVGFIPREVLIEVKPKGKKHKSFEQSFKWVVG